MMRCLTKYSGTLSSVERQRRIAACPRLTLDDVAAVIRSYRRAVPLAVRHLLVERLDVMSGPYHLTRLLGFLVEAGHDEAHLWATLLQRATREGQHRLVAAFGDTLEESPRFGAIWTPETWAALRSAYPPGSGGIDEDTVWALLDIFQQGVHHADETSASGELWVDTLVAWTDLFPQHDPNDLAAIAAWFLSTPGRLSDAAVARLLAAGSPVLRSWALLHVVPLRRIEDPPAADARAVGPAPQTLPPARPGRSR